MPYDPIADQTIVVVSATGDNDAEVARRRAVESFLALARRRFTTIANAETLLRRDQLEDQEFRASQQWPQSVKALREQDGRPCLTINRLNAFISQVTNQQRASRPAIQINPVDSGADKRTAEVLQGIIRHIEYQSNADAVYSTGCDQQVGIGRGWWRVLTEFSDEGDLFAQEIKLRRILNPFTVYMDPACIEPDYSDARYAFLIEDVPKDEYLSRFPRSEVASLTLFETIGDQHPDWMPEGHVRIAEYWYVDEVEDEVVRVRVPTEPQPVTMTAAELTELVTSLEAMQPGASGAIVELDRRTVRTRQVYSALINAVEVLEGNAEKTAGRPWDGRWIPIVPILGMELLVDGRVDLRGMVRDAKDPQRAYNYWVSAETEAIALAPRSPFIIAEGQISGYERFWDTANTRNHAYLPYKPTAIEGHLVGSPQRQSAEPPIGAITAAIAQADNDMKATTQLYDASLGERGPEQSGRAILARQKQGDIANHHYLDNLRRAIVHTGRILVDLIPRVYSTPRVMRLLGTDDQERTVLIHAGQPADALSGVERPQDFKPGDVFDLSVGRYDVTVSMGPSFSSRRQEAVESMLQLVQANPAIFPMIGDLLVASMDWPQAAKIAERLQKMLPPPLQAEGPEGAGRQIPPELQTQMQEMAAQVQQLQGALTEAQQRIDHKVVETEAEARLKQVEWAGRERVASLQAQAEQTQLVLKAQIDRMAQLLEQAHERDLQRERLDHEQAVVVVGAVNRRAPSP